VSNGGGASVRAAEEDKDGLIDGIAVAEPNVNPVFDDRFVIVQGSSVLREHSRSLYDYTTLVNVYQGCASVAQGANAPLNLAASPDRCAALHRLGLLKSDTLAQQASEAQAVINNFGILPDQNFVQPSHWFLNVPQSIAVTYANAYGRFSVADNHCGFSMGATDAKGAPIALAAPAEALLFGTSNGIPPTGGINLINNAAPGGPKENRLSTPDQNLAGALCLRGLATGQDPGTGQGLRGADRAAAERIAAGVEEIRAKGDLHGLPAIFVTGRNDAILPPNHASRAYYGLNQLVEGARSQLRYYEVTNAQHLDTLNALPGFDTRLIPLHRYFLQAMDLMFDHLKNSTALPPSQVVRTTPRQSAAQIIDPVINVPPIRAGEPSSLDRIVFENGQLRIPD
jgi:hydroxybutyrate-dimer hydrolase